MRLMLVTLLTLMMAPVRRWRDRLARRTRFSCCEDLGFHRSRDLVDVDRLEIREGSRSRPFRLSIRRDQCAAHELFGEKDS
jgi:hypothetical protein